MNIAVLGATEDYGFDLEREGTKNDEANCGIDGKNDYRTLAKNVEVTAREGRWMKIAYSGIRKAD